MPDIPRAAPGRTLGFVPIPSTQDQQNAIGAHDRRTQAESGGMASQSMQFAQIPPRPEDEQKYMNLPDALGRVPRQDALGRVYMIPNLHRKGDPCNPPNPNL